MTAVGIVGAGVAGAGAAYALEQAAAVDVTVLERGDRVGGRAASRSRGPSVYDHGANYLKADDDRVARLVTADLDTAGLVDVTEPVYTFDDAGTVAPGRDVDDHKWTYESGLRDLTRRLLERTTATVHLEAAATRPERVADGWRVHDADGERWGPFDAVVLTPPAPQTAVLLAAADWPADLQSALVAALTDVTYREIYSTVLGYGFAIDRPYYALVHTGDAHAVGWLSREECKRGHVPDGETVLVVQASHDWSVEHADERTAANAERLAGRAAGIVGDDRLETPDWTDGRLWRPALPEASVDETLVADAREHDLYLAGDAVPGEGRIHAALRSGLDVAARVVGDR
jgi:predicted NAD/FAD-dependent oxidoreductase